MRLMDRFELIFTTDRGGSIKLTSLNMSGELKDRGSWTAPAKDPIKGLVFGVQEKKFATAHEEKTVKVWDFATLTVERRLEGHGSDVQTVDWHPSKSLLASGGKDRLLKFWDPVSGRNICNLFNHTNTITKVRFNKNENFLAATGKDQLVRLYDIRMMKEFFVFRGHNSEVLDFEWHPRRENHCLSSDSEGKLCYWVYPYDVVSDIQYHEKDVQVFRGAFNSLGTAVASLGFDRKIKLWQVESV